MKSPVHKSSFAGRLREGLEYKKAEFDRRPRFRKTPFRVTSGTDLAHIFNEGYAGRHIHAATAQFWINGEHFPRGKNLRRLLEVLGIAEEWLLYGTGPGPMEIKYQQANSGRCNDGWQSAPQAQDAEDGLDLELTWIRFFRALDEIMLIAGTLYSYASPDPNKNARLEAERPDNHETKGS